MARRALTRPMAPNLGSVPSEPGMGRWPGDAKRSHGTKDPCAFLGLKVVKWPGGLKTGLAPKLKMASGPRVGPGQARYSVVTDSKNACPRRELGERA